MRVWVILEKFLGFPRLSPSVVFLIATISVPFCVMWHTSIIPSLYIELIALYLILITIFLHTNDTDVYGFNILSIILLCAVFYIGIQHWFLEEAFTDMQQNAIFYFVVGALIANYAYSLKKLNGLDRILPIVATGILVGGFFNCLVALSQFLQKETVIGALYQANNYTDYSFIAVLSLLYLYKERFIGSVAFYCLSLFMLFCISLSTSRSILLYLAATYFLYSWILKDFSPKILIIFLLVAAYALTNEEMLLRLLSADGERLRIFHMALDLFKANDLFGVGWGNFFIWLTPIRWANHTHNLFLNILVECGYVGFILFLLACFFFYAEVSSSIFSSTHEQWYILNVLTIMLIHSMTEFPLWYANFFILFCLFLGFLLPPRKIQEYPNDYESK